jgi:hypothetical protein
MKAILARIWSHVPRPPDRDLDKRIAMRLYGDPQFGTYKASTAGDKVVEDLIDSLSDIQRSKVDEIIRDMDRTNRRRRSSL